MATKNKAIAVYLPDDLLGRVTDFCNANGLTRTYRDNIQDPERAGKTEPSLGTGIVKMLYQLTEGGITAPTSTDSQSSPDIDQKIDAAITGLKAELVELIEKKL
jgi:hypothetical protein